MLIRYLLTLQCVIVATRPLVLSVLRERLENLGRGQEDLNCFNSFLALTTTLITTGIKSAAKTFYILSNEENLLGEKLAAPTLSERNGSWCSNTLVRNVLAIRP